MAGIILNLASLKSKADTAGVANTANNTTPNLCPPKSTIAGYVTNGATTVVISGTWANNLLVEAASVVVNKYVTGTETVYRSVNVGDLQGGSDIPAAGGSSYAYKTVTYEYATKTYYSDGTSTVGSYSSGSATVKGSTVTASSLGTTVKARTKVGTSSKTLTVAGTSVSVSKNIYQAENKVEHSDYVYKGHSCGPSSADDIPASGGQKRASATVTYKYATRNYYTSGDISIGSYSNTSGIIYGGYVSANSLGTTAKARTAIGTSTPSGTVGGVAINGGACTVYQQQNKVESTSTVYKDVSVGTSSVASDIPASGGQRRASAVVSYKYATKSVYTSGSDSTGSYSNGSTTIYGSYVSANSLGTTVKARTKIGTSTPSGTAAGATRTGTAVDVYLAQNKVESTPYVYKDVSVGTSSASDIPAGGGTVKAQATVTYKRATKTIYTSGSETTGTYSNLSTTIYGSGVTAASKGTTVSGRTSTGNTSTPSGTVAGATRTGTAVTIYLAQNKVEYTATQYSDHSTGTSSASDIPAEGGKRRASAVVSYKSFTRSYYTSGSTSDGTKTNNTSTIYGSYVEASSLGTTMKVRTSTGSTSTPSGTVGNKACTGTAVTIYQAANYVTKLEPTTSEGATYHVKYSNISNAGGSSTPQGTGRCKYTFKSGSTITSGSTSPVTGVVASYSRTYSEYNDSSNAFSVNSNGTVSAGKNTGSSRSVTVKSVLTVSVTYTSSFSSLSKPAAATLTHYPTCTLDAGSENYYLSATLSITNVPYYGGNVSKPSISNIVLHHEVNGTDSTTNLTTSDISITGYANNSTGVEPSADSSYTAYGFSCHMNFNDSTSLVDGNYIFMRIKYTPSGWTTVTGTFVKRAKQNANPGNGFTMILYNNYPSVDNPVIHLKSSNGGTTRYSTGSFRLGTVVLNQNWSNTGYVSGFTFSLSNAYSSSNELLTKHKFLTITGHNELNSIVLIRQKIDLSNYISNGQYTSSYCSMTNSFNTSDYDNGGWAELIFTFSLT